MEQERKEAIKIKLKHPVPGEKEDEIISKIRLKRLRGKHLHLLPKTVEGETLSPGEMLPLIAAMADLPLKIVEEIDLIDDLLNIIDMASDFFDFSQTTGKN
jgi:hypothetical protein